VILVITYNIVCAGVILIKENTATIQPGALLFDTESRWAYGLSVPLSSVEPWQLTQIPGVGGGLAVGLEKLILRLSHHDTEDPITTLKRVHGIGEGKAKSFCRYFYAHGCNASPSATPEERRLNTKQKSKGLNSKRKKGSLTGQTKHSGSKASAAKVTTKTKKRSKKVSLPSSKLS
jgi:hypothetical protein